jgi:drug/metabolite transporter (DMT)-like permease
MIFIVLAIVLGLLVLILFKTFPNYKVNTFAAILYNYVFAAVTGFLLSNKDDFSVTVQEKEYLFAIPLGLLFITVFYLISQTAQKVGISVASVANKMSVIMTVLFSVLILHQQLNSFMIVGIICALFSVYLTCIKKEKQSGSFFLPFLLFLGSGAIDTSLNAANAFFIRNNEQSAVFTTLIFSSALVFGICALLISSLKGKMSAKEFFLPKNIFAGFCLGVPNYFSIYFIFLALDSKLLNSAQLFPVLNVANVALAALTAHFIFKEKLSKMNVAGILLAILAIILLST